MAKSYGVRCKKCGEHIHIESAEPSEKDKITFYTPPLTPVLCPHCGHTDEYSSTDNDYK
jgi:DNA-directed RNA polymerase subunit RPC12/RpoP